jgi:hypothetical protein
LRVGYTLQRSTQQKSGGVLHDATLRSRDPLQARIPPETKALTVVHQERDLLRLERDLLRRELEAAQVREQAALKREQAVREREALLLCMVEQVQQQNQCLLDMPRILLLLRYQNLAPQQTPMSHVETCASGAQWI